MIRVALFFTLALPASAQWSILGSDGPGGFSVWHNDHWDVNGVHVYAPTAAPEAAPTLALTAAGAALVLRRNGGAK